MFILDPKSGSAILNWLTNLSIFNPENMIKSFRYKIFISDRGCGFFSFFIRIPDTGVKNTRSRILDLDPQHWSKIWKYISLQLWREGETNVDWHCCECKQNFKIFQQVKNLRYVRIRNWISVVLMPIRIRIWIGIGIKKEIRIQIRIRMSIKTMPIHNTTTS